MLLFSSSFNIGCYFLACVNVVVAVVAVIIAATVVAVTPSCYWKTHWLLLLIPVPTAAANGENNSSQRFL